MKDHQRYFVNKFKVFHVGADTDENEYENDIAVKEIELLGSGYDEKSYSERKISSMTEKLLQEDSDITRKIVYELTRAGPNEKG
jgi:hypothetical protein